MANNINCPYCHREIEVDQVLRKQTEEAIRHEMENQYRSKEDEVKHQEALLKKQQEEFEEKKKNENKLFQERLEKDREKIIQEERQKAIESLQSEYNEKEIILQSELNRRKEELQKKNQEEINLRKQIELNEEKFQEMELANRKKLMEERAEMEKKIRQHVTQSLELEQQEKQQQLQKNIQDQDLKILEYQKKLEQTQKALEDAQRKSQQGSTQLQGEIHELALEQELRDQFPYDTVEEVKKGMRGADCIMIINDKLGNQCGSIIIESKRTKDFKEEWIPKLKADMLSANADIAVIVTQTMPKGMTHFGNREGVWICPKLEFVPLISVLRAGIISVAHALSSQENKGDKMVMLYNFITGTEFRMQLEAIVDGFRSLKNDLEKEKRAMERIWKEREKQIEKVILNTIHMYGNVKGIAGNSIGSIQTLELDTSDGD